MKTLESYRGTRLPSTPDAAEKNIPAKALAPKTEFEVNIYPYAGNFTEEYEDGTKAEDKLYFGSRESAEHYVREVNRAGLKFRIIKAAINKRICLGKRFP